MTRRASHTRSTIVATITVAILTVLAVAAMAPAGASARSSWSAAPAAVVSRSSWSTPTAKAHKSDADLKRRQRVVRRIRATHWSGHCLQCLWQGKIFIDRAYVNTGTREFAVHGRYIERRQNWFNPLGWTSYVCSTTGTFYWRTQWVDGHERCHKW